MTINPTIIPMPSRKPLLAVPAPMLHILQPTNTKRNTAQTRNHTDAQRPPTNSQKRSPQKISLRITLKRGGEKKMMVIEHSQTDSQCISARHIGRLADRSLLAHGTLDRDGGVAEGGFEVDAVLALRLGRSGVFHRGLCAGVGLEFDSVCCQRRSRTRGRSDVVS